MQNTNKKLKIIEDKDKTLPTDTNGNNTYNTNNNIIRKLPQHIIEKISASETITKPEIALKELIENSIDANSTKIEIFLTSSKKFANKNLNNNEDLNKDINNNIKGINFRIRDNGTGINENNFELLCERHCTSKLISNNSNNISDINENIKSFGFRGEALASICQISSISIITKHKNSANSIKLEYKNTKLKSKLDTSNYIYETGTEIIVNNMSVNTKKDIEIKDVMKLVGSFQVKFVEIMFRIVLNGRDVFKLDSKNSNLMNNFENFNTKILNNFENKNIENSKIFFNPEIIQKKQNLLKTHFSLKNLLVSKSENFLILFSDLYTTFSSFTIICFLNNRLISFPLLETSIKNFYKNNIKKKKYPFVYIEIFLDKRYVDVNYHPSKKEILIENEDIIIESIIENIKSEINKCDEKDVKLIDYLKSFDSINNTEIENVTNNNKSNRKVYNDHSISELGSYDLFKENSIIKNDAYEKKIKKYEDYDQNKKIKKPLRNLNLKSLKNITLEYKIPLIKHSCNFTSKLIIVGFFDENNLILQYEHEIVLCKILELLKNYFLQRLLLDFGNFDVIEIIDNKYLKEISNNSELNNNNLIKIFKFDKIKSLMLFDYFSIKTAEISSGNYILTGIPSLCSEKISLETFYKIIESFQSLKLQNEEETFKYIIETIIRFILNEIKSDEKIIINIFNNDVKRYLKRSENVDNCYNRLVSLKELYRVFDR